VHEVYESRFRYHQEAQICVLEGIVESLRIVPPGNLMKGYFARSIMEILEYSSSVKYLQELSQRCNNLPLRQLI